MNGTNVVIKGPPWIPSVKKIGGSANWREEECKDFIYNDHSCLTFTINDSNAVYDKAFPLRLERKSDKSYRFMVWDRLDFEKEPKPIQ